MADQENGMSWLPAPIRKMAAKALKNYLKKQNVKSLILVYDETLIKDDDEDGTGAFSARTFQNNIGKDIVDIVRMRELVRQLERRNNFLEDFRNEQLGLPTRAQQLKEGK